MNSLKRIIYNPTLWIYLLTFVLHVGLLNVNVAEWGDSYRILRASEFIRRGTYPIDEKRQPLYSALISIRPEQIDPVLWARIEMVAISLAALYLFRRLTSNYVAEKKYLDIASLFFVLNPVYLYWSIRIMADVLFSVWAMLALYFHIKGKQNSSWLYNALSGFIAGLAVLTRFEGYLLFGALGLGYLLSDDLFLKRRFTYLVSSIKNNFKNIIYFSVAFLVTVVPFILYRNPLTSSYFGEPSGRTYDLRMVWVFAVSLIYIFGSLPLTQLVFSNFLKFRVLRKFSYAPLAFFSLELLLILVWPAAVPRLFVAILPLMLIGTAHIYETTKGELFSNKNSPVLWTLVPLAFFVLSQYVLRLQFLVTMKYIFVALVVLQIVTYVAGYLKHTNIFLSLICISMAVWGLSVIWMHKDIYIWSKTAALYVSGNLQGKVGYNDANSVSSWYLLNRPGHPTGITGVYVDTTEPLNLHLPYIESLNLDYLVLTNEDDPIEFDALSRTSYLELVKEFRYNVNGRDFISAVFKVSKGTNK